MNLSENQTDDPLKTVTRDDFAAQLNTKFRFFLPPNWVEGELVEVSRLKEHPRQQIFSLLFRMAEEFPPFQGSYLFEHEKIGSAEIFIVPVERTENGVLFEAVFNRLLEKR